MLKKLLPKLTLAFFLVFTGFLIGSGSKKETQERYLPPNKEYRNSQNYRYINPLLDCDITDNSPDPKLQNIKKVIQQEIVNQEKQNHASHISVYYRDLNNGPWLGIDENALFTPASLIKVPILMAVLKEAESNPAYLDKMIPTPENISYEEQNVLPSIVLEPNQEYSIFQLLERMIVYSDNRAKDLILENISEDKVLQVFSDLGIDPQKIINNPNNNISVKEYSSFFRILYNSSYLNKEMSEKALSLLAQVDYQQGLSKLLPKDTTLSHKFGERFYYDTEERQLHDCGIVYHPQKPYLLCVMTRGENNDNLSDVISRISLVVYENIQ